MSLLSSYFETSRAYLIGIQNYDTIKGLSTPLQDIDDINECLLNHEFDSKNILNLRNPAKKDIENILSRMQDEIGFRDRVLFYFAGHGIAHDSGDEPKGFIIPKDGNRNDERTFIDMNWLAEKISRLRCKHFLLILDCCFAGSFRWADNYRDGGLDQTKKLYRQKFERFVSDDTKVFQVITSSSYNEEAIDRLLNLGARENLTINNRNSPFASIIIDALKGRIDNSCQDGIITTTRLYNYIDIKFSKYLSDNKIVQRQFPNYFPLRETTKGQFIFLIPQTAETAITNLPNLELKNPYKGLASFKSTDSHLFFGRKRVIENLITLFTKAKSNDIILISGSSGIGKSSLVMAGLIPAMLEYYPDSLKVMPVRPGDIKNKEDYVKQFITIIESITRPFILFIDQFEEMVTVCSEKEQTIWENFINSNRIKKNCRVVISMRSDFEGQLRANSSIKLGSKNRFVVPRLERNEIRDIIIQPALQSIIQIETISKQDLDSSQFLDRICDEAMQSLGSLPLLSFALEQWYKVNLEKTTNRYVLKEEYYNGIGGINGALGTIIDAFMGDLRNSEEKEYLKRLMLRMVTVQNENFARVKVYDFELDFFKVDHRTRNQRQLLEEMIKLRIVTTNRESNLLEDTKEQIYYELAHDAVITSWKQLWEWLNSEKINIPVYRQLGVDTQKWKDGKNKNSLLWSESNNLSIVSKEFQNQIVVNNNWIRLRNGFVSTITYGFRPQLKEKSNLFNLEERNFIRKSIIKVRQNHAILNILYMLILLAVISTLNFWANSKIQKKQIILGKNRIDANNLGVNSRSIEAPTAYYLLKKAESIDPDNPTISQLAFDLFENEIASFNFLPTNIIPLNPLKDDSYSIAFKDNINLLVSKFSNSFQVNLNSGEITDLKKESELNFPDQLPGFIQKMLYNPEDPIIPLNRQGNETFYIVAPNLQTNSKFIIITPSSISLSKFIWQGFILRDTCISKELKFAEEIKYSYFIKDSSRVILICNNNSIFLADFEVSKVIQLIKGYTMPQTSHYYTISNDGNKFAAITNNNLVYVWNLESVNPFTIDKTNDTKKISIDKKLQNSLKDGDTILLDNEGNKINIWLFYKTNDYALIISHNNSFDEFIVYQKIPDRYYIINKKSSVYQIELPVIPNIDKSVSINYSTDGETIFYSVYPDSILSQYPSLKKIKSWIHNQPALISDTIH